MFTINHIIWLFICFLIIVISLRFIFKDKISFDCLLNLCCVTCILSEVIKTFSVLKFVPLSDGSSYVPYLEMNHLPLHLCSIQIIFIFIIKFINKDSKIFHTLIAFMYPSTILGAIGAIFIPTIFTTTITIQQAFTHPMAYQFFLYHTMLVILGFSIYHFYSNELSLKDYFRTILIALTLFFISIYTNSIFSIPNYENGTLVSVDKVTDFFFSLIPPINIALNSYGAWLLYLLVFMLIGSLLTFILYLPIILKTRKHS